MSVLSVGRGRGREGEEKEKKERIQKKKKKKKKERVLCSDNESSILIGREVSERNFFFFFFFFDTAEHPNQNIDTDFNSLQREGFGAIIQVS